MARNVDARRVGAPPGRVVTLADAGGRIAPGDDPLLVARELLDQAARLPRTATAERPEPTGDQRGDALLGLAEHLARGRRCTGTDVVPASGDQETLGFVDASIVALAERTTTTAIATLNRRDFTVVRPAHAEAFELLP